ncbi:exodeoxyribonuclease VII small subunit [Maridesulfovibrio bastinii]|jgi:exodeoxyribonuclease VII small subunit|uniref:exodeoxyribonuclease VII small subunit n=1 Tax=Maridesulfovibrio bastinii TaxID=47157 RepID=UPI0004184D83|nr:exodeoxyribonuclease VII small subunit [Maridesulfovibrio bastinii]
MQEDNRSFEERLERLKEIVTGLERGDLPLEDGVSLFKEGLELARGCSVQLENARNEVKVVSDGLLKDFEDIDDESEESVDDD